MMNEQSHSVDVEMLLGDLVTEQPGAWLWASYPGVLNLSPSFPIVAPTGKGGRICNFRFVDDKVMALIIKVAFMWGTG